MGEIALATQVFIKSNADFVARRLQKRLEQMKSDGQTETSRAAQYGKELMFRLAPKDTGKTARAISYRQGKRADGANATILIGDGHPDRLGQIKNTAGKYAGKKTGLTYFMNYGHTFNVWKSGEPRYIQVGVEETRKRFKSGVRKLVNSFVTGK
jgi:hypothetical protein